MVKKLLVFKQWIREGFVLLRELSDNSFQRVEVSEIENKTQCPILI